MRVATDSRAVWARMTSRVADLYMANESAPAILRRMRDVTNWTAAGHAKHFDLNIEEHPTRYALVADGGKYWATVRMTKGPGRGDAMFIEPNGVLVSRMEFAAPYESDRDAMNAMWDHAKTLLRRWGPPPGPESHNDSLWDRWFGHRAARLTKDERGSRVYLLGDTYSFKDDLKRKGFRWDPDARGWYIQTNRWPEVADWLEPAIDHPGSRPTPLSHMPGSTNPTGLATEKQVLYALSLIRRLGRGWFDTDMGDSGMAPPKQSDLEKYTVREIADLINELKAQF